MMEANVAPRHADELAGLSRKLGMELRWNDQLLAGGSGVPTWIRPVDSERGPQGYYTGELPYRRDGFDPVCGQPDRFVSDNNWFRDAYQSRRCGSKPRERALAFVLAALQPELASVTVVHESSPSNGDLGLSAHLARVLGPTRYKPTQYHPTIPCGEALPIPGNVALDLEKQSCIPDGSFDLVITQDVFEHIYDAAAAFAEIERTLKPGGMHIFTVPVTSKMNATFEAATRASDGSVIMHAPPEVHGNPMSGDGSLLTHQWGFDIVDFVRRHARGTSARQMPLGLSPLPGSLKGFAHKATIVPI